jgi:hypothetical protein
VEERHVRVVQLAPTTEGHDQQSDGC